MSLMCSNDKIDTVIFDKPTGKPQKAESVVQINGVMIVRLANGRFLTSARDFHKWAYPIDHSLVIREPLVRGLVSIGYITAKEADEHMAEHRRAKERRDVAFATKMVLEYGDKLGIGQAVASAIESRNETPA